MEKLIKNANGQWSLIKGEPAPPKKMLFGPDHPDHSDTASSRIAQAADTRRGEGERQIAALSDQSTGGSDRTPTNQQHMALLGNMTRKLNFKREHEETGELMPGFNDEFIKAHALSAHLLHNSGLTHDEYEALHAHTAANHSPADIFDPLEEIGHLVDWHNSDQGKKDEQARNLHESPMEGVGEGIDHGNVQQHLRSAFDKIHRYSHGVRAGHTIVYPNNPDDEFWDAPGYPHHLEDEDITLH